ncbi:MAG: hypothetical protein HZA36_03330 [Parcubacteria group bacterium]|nr:hypothetical protein [Parcubacteria group bacterium]
MIRRSFFISLLFPLFLLMNFSCFAATEREEFDVWLKKTHGKTSTFVEWKQLVPGVHGYCITVLKGLTLSVNELTYVGIAPHPLTNTEKVLLFKIGKPLASVTTVAGMSGSPVYVKHGGLWKLVGAYAYGFNSYAPTGEYLAGVTPIKAMLDQESSLRGGTSPMQQNHGNVLSSVGYTQSISGLGVFSVKPLIAFTRTTVDRSSNVADFSLVRVERDPQPGDAVSVFLVKGDVMDYATGTITYVDLSKKMFYAFGHPFLSDLGIGTVVLPAHRTEIVLTVMSQAGAYKFSGKILEHFGTIDKDCVFGIRGRIGPEQETLLPISFRISVDGKNTNYSFGVVRQKALMPVVLLNSMRTLADNLYSLDTETVGIMKTTLVFADGTTFPFNDSRVSEPSKTVPNRESRPEDIFTDFVKKVSLVMNSVWNFNVQGVQTSLTLTSRIQRLFLDSGVVMDSAGVPTDSVKVGETVYVLLGVRTANNSARYTIRIPCTVPHDVNLSESQRLVMVMRSGLHYRNEAPIALNHVPDSANEFLRTLKTLVLGDKDPQRLYVQVLLPADALPERDEHIADGGRDGVWVPVRSLDNLRDESVGFKMTEQVFDGPSPDYILDINVVVRLKIQK